MNTGSEDGWCVPGFTRQPLDNRQVCYSSTVLIGLARSRLTLKKTELLWAGTRHSVTSLLRSHDPTLILGTDAVKAADVVRVLGVLFTPELALDRHATTVSASCVNCVA